MEPEITALVLDILAWLSHTLGWWMIPAWIAAALLLWLLLVELRDPAHEQFLAGLAAVSPLRGRWLRYLFFVIALLVLAPMVGAPAGALLLTEFCGFPYRAVDSWPGWVWPHYGMSHFTSSLGAVVGTAAIESGALLMLGKSRAAGWVLIAASLAILVTRQTPKYGLVPYWFVMGLEVPGSAALRWSLLLLSFGAVLLLKGRVTGTDPQGAPTASA